MDCSQGQQSGSCLLSLMLSVSAFSQRGLAGQRLGMHVLREACVGPGLWPAGTPRPVQPPPSLWVFCFLCFCSTSHTPSLAVGLPLFPVNKEGEARARTQFPTIFCTFAKKNLTPRGGKQGNKNTHGASTLPIPDYRQHRVGRGLSRDQVYKQNYNLLSEATYSKMGLKINKIK